MRYLSRAMKLSGQLHFGDISASLSTALGGTLNTSAPGIQIIATELELGCAFI